MYATAWAAKSLATLDVVSGGRPDLVVGVGGRRHDHDRAERLAGRHQRLDDQVVELRRIWAGGDVDGEPVGPAPVQSGGPPIFRERHGSEVDGTLLGGPTATCSLGAGHRRPRNVDPDDG